MNVRRRLLDQIVNDPRYVNAPDEIVLTVSRDDLNALMEELHPVERFTNVKGEWYFPLVGHPHAVWPRLVVARTNS